MTTNLASLITTCACVYDGQTLVGERCAQCQLLALLDQRYALASRINEDAIDVRISEIVDNAMDEKLEQYAEKDDLDDYVKDHDLASAIESAIEDSSELACKDDLSDYVEKDDLESEIEEGVKQALADADIVQDVAAGAARGAMAAMAHYATIEAVTALHTAHGAAMNKLVSDLQGRLDADAPARLAALTGLTLRQRLSWLLFGTL